MHLIYYFRLFIIRKNVSHCGSVVVAVVEEDDLGKFNVA